MRRWLVLAVLAGSTGGLVPPGAAQPPVSPADWEQGALAGRAGDRGIWVRPRLKLAAASLQELLPGSSARSAGTLRAGRAITPDPIWHGRLLRELPRVWELYVAEDTRPGDLDVRYEVHSPDGRSDQLVHLSDPVSTIAVRVVPREPVLVGVDGSRALVRGGLALELEVDSVRSAGSYRGTLTVTVNQL